MYYRFNLLYFSFFSAQEAISHLFLHLGYSDHRHSACVWSDPAPRPHSLPSPGPGLPGLVAMDSGHDPTGYGSPKPIFILAG